MKKHIMYVVYSLACGGIEKYSVLLYKYINKEKYEFNFITRFNRAEFFDNEVDNLGGVKIPLLDIKNKSTNSFSSIKKAFEISSRDYTIAYFNISSPSSVFKFPLICRLCGNKNIIIHSHNSLEDSSSPLKQFLNFCGRIYINKIASAKLACSDKAALWMFGKQSVRKNEIEYIHNGIETDLFDFNLKTRSKMQELYGIKDEDFVIGHVARFSKQKNHKFLIELFKEIHNIQPNSKLFLIGIGDLQETIKKQVEDLKLLDSVVFLNEQSNISDFMQMFDVFLLPSLYEGLPVVSIEAQAAGLRCFLSDCITNECDITGNVFFKSLSDTPLDWAKFILSNKEYERISQKEKIVDAGYDMQTTALKIQEIFEKIENNIR